MSIQQPYLAGLDEPVSIFQIDLSIAGGLDFRPRQHDTGLKLFYDFVIMKRLSINRDVFH